MTRRMFTVALALLALLLITAAAAEAKFCGHCGKNNRDGNAYCTKCGEALEDEASTLSKDLVPQDPNPQPRILVVTTRKGCLILRRGPGLDTQPAGVIERSARLEFLGEAFGPRNEWVYDPNAEKKKFDDHVWLKVRVEGYVGWVSHRFVRAAD